MGTVNGPVRSGRWSVLGGIPTLERGNDQINETLRGAIHAENAPVTLEALRRIIREELRAA